ncbi:MAG: hypothetical protein ACJAT4_001445 [Granulosicoccus sp.]|jgi:hypothetical protein
MRLFFIILAIICTFPMGTFAQKSSDSSAKFKKNTLKYGYGSSFHKNGMLGNYQYGEYTRFFGKRVAMGVLAGYIKADNANDQGAANLAFNAWKGDLNLYLLPINNSINSFKIGGGGSYWMGEFKSRDSVEVDFTVVDEENYGWNVAAEYEIYIANTVTIGARASFTQSMNGEHYYFFGLNGGFKF